MKTHFVIFTVMLVLIGGLSQFGLNPDSGKFESFGQDDKVSKMKKKDATEKKDSVKTVPYVVTKSAPTLPYTIMKTGNGSRIMFTEKFGARSLPGVQFHNTSGIKYSMGKKRGFENVTFPFKCSISCSSGRTNGFNHKLAMLNDFEIIIYEPGNWEVSFFN